MVFCGAKCEKYKQSVKRASELNSRCLIYEESNGLTDLLPLTPFLEKTQKNNNNSRNKFSCLINQMYVAFYLDKKHYLVFYIGIISSNHL